MGIYVKTQSFLDTFTDSGFLTEHMPQIEQSYAVARGWQDFHHENEDKGMWGPEMKHIASIDPNIGIVAMDFDWNIFETPKKFYGWLRKHPECRVTK